ncbi:unnamed protein product, partial [Symbiodinium pilosum]
VGSTLVGVGALSALAASTKRSRPSRGLRARGGDVVETLPTTEINYYKLDSINTTQILASMRC